MTTIGALRPKTERPAILWPQLKAWLSAAAFLLVFVPAMASHFRGGTITWTRLSGNTVSFTVTHSWRSGTGSGQYLSFGDGSSSVDNAVLVSTSGGYETWRGTVTHTYAGPGPYTAYMESCCRISTLANAADDDFRVESIVCLTGGNNNSPVTSVPAVIQMSTAGQSVQLVATDADGNAVRFDFSTLARSGISFGPMPPPGFSMTSTGLLTYDGLQGYTAGTQFALQITVLELAPSCGANVSADFIVEMVTPTFSNQPPVCTLNGSATNTVNVGQPFTLSLTGTDANGGNLTVTHNGLPSGATLSPANGPSPLTTVFNWTPSGLQSGQSFPVNVIFTDAQGGNSFCSFTVTVNAGCLPPTVTCPANIVAASTNGLCGANVGFLASATGNAPVISYSQSPGSFFPVGIQPVTVTASNGCGASTCQFTVTVEDHEAPAITCPTSFIAPNNPGQCTGTVVFSVTATDNCGGYSVSQTAGLPSGSVLPIGTSAVTYQATDASGNTAACSFNITVADLEAPVALCPAAISVGSDLGRCDAVVSFAAGFTDNCLGGGITQTAGPASGSRFPTGTTTVEFTATDAAGNSSTCSFGVSVTETQNPTISCPGNIHRNNSPGNCGAVVSYNVSTNDNCPGETFAVASGLASGSMFPVGATTNVLVVTDAAGNTASCSFTVTVTDNENPTIMCPQTITTMSCGGNVSFAATASDNCQITNIDYTPQSGSYFPVGTTSVTVRAFDSANRTATCTFDVVVVETPITVTITSPVDACGHNVTRCCALTLPPLDTAGHGTHGSHHPHRMAQHAADLGAELDADRNALTGSRGVHGTGHLGSAVHGSHPLHDHGHGSHMTGGHDDDLPPCGHDGLIISEASGGCPPYSYLWSNGAVTASVSGLAAGTYTLTVTDANGNVGIQSLSLTQALPLQLSVSASNPTCYQGADGSATANVADGCGPYTYHWSNGSTLPTITGLTTGNYCVTVGDAYGCFRYACVEVQAPNGLHVDAGPNRMVYPAYAPQACATLAGSVSNGQPPYAIRWTNAQGTVFGTSLNLVVCPSTTTVYYLSVTDAGGCQVRDSVLVCAVDVTCSGGQIRICHGRGAQRTTLCLSAAEVPAHLAHGDLLGACDPRAVCNFPGGIQGSHLSGSHAKNAGHPIPEPSQDLTVRAFPSPSTGIVDVEFAMGRGMADVHAVRLRVSDIYGRTLYSTAVEVQNGTGGIRLDLAKYPEGIYLITLEANDEKVVAKVIRQ